MYRIRFAILSILLFTCLAAKSQGWSGTVPPGYVPDNTTSIPGYMLPPTYSYTYPGAYLSGVLVNWVRATTLFTPITDTGTISSVSTHNKSISTAYSDGLGRTIQTVVSQLNPENDLVSIALYDSFGRQPANLLPYGTASNYGSFKTDAFASTGQAAYYAAYFASDADPYGVTAFDDTSMYRAVIQMKPGASYVGSWVGKTSRILLNQSTDSVMMWDYFVPGSLPTTETAWAANTLMIQETLDEAGNSTRKYINKDGQTILTKVQLASPAGLGNTGWLCTYYVYDSLGRIRSVIPPLAVNYLNSNGWSFSSGTTVFSELCYSYTYDNLGRTITKTLPGRNSINIIYDSTNKPVLVQDGNLSSTNQWLYVKYDGLGRKILTGKFLNTSAYSAATLQTMMNGAISSGAASNNFLIFLQTNIIENNYDTTSVIPDAEIHTITYYDNYSNAPAYYGYSTSAMALLPGGTNAVIETLSKETYTMPTGGYTRIMNGTTVTPQWTGGAMYYDPNGRMIQAQGLNFKGGLDTMSIQYDFSGAPLNTYSSQFNPMASYLTQVPWVHVLKSYDYDNNNRFYSEYQKMNGDSLFRQLNTFQYNRVGQLDQKTYGSVETQQYTYRIWGDLESINKNFCQSGGTGSYYGEILYYDYGFYSTTPTGLPSGMEWRLKGSPTIERAYGYSYDNAGRLTLGGYSQSTSAAAWQNTTESYTASNITYDANGNLQTMTQIVTSTSHPVGVSGPYIMDDLSYTYNNGGWSNKLQAVSDTAKFNSGLGDFNELGGDSAVDYNYDNNGNAIKDVNRNITAIRYNYQNKPYEIDFNPLGRYIYFTYDANGTLLRKQIVDTGIANVPDTIDYLGGLQYKNDTLVYAAHDEGRGRPVSLVNTTGDTSIFFEYDYFIKDHQNNVRSVATEVVDSGWFAFGVNTALAASGSINTSHIKFGGRHFSHVEYNPNPDTTNPANQYSFYVGWHPYLAGMEIDRAAVEDALFSNIDSTRAGKPLSTDSADQKASLLNAAQNRLIGPSMVLRVMAGDSLYISTQAYYSGADQNDSAASPFAPVLNGLLTALAGSANTNAAAGENGWAAYGSSTSQLQNNFSNYFNSLNGNDSIDNTKPQAFLNYIVLDDQMNIVYPASGFKQVKQADAWSTLSLDNTMAVAQNGYIIVFVSNRSPYPVNFDNLFVTHYTGSLQTENNYYPYGLTLTTNAITAPTNNILYQSNELHHNEFADGTGLNWYNYNARMYDPQIGRWHASDPLTESQNSFSPYHYCFGNPVVFTDPSGLFPTKYPLPIYGGDSPPDPFMAIADGSFFYTVNPGGDMLNDNSGGFASALENFGGAVGYVPGEGNFGDGNWTDGFGGFQMENRKQAFLNTYGTTNPTNYQSSSSSSPPAIASTTTTSNSESGYGGGRDGNSFNTILLQQLLTLLGLSDPVQLQGAIVHPTYTSSSTQSNGSDFDNWWSNAGTVTTLFGVWVTGLKIPRPGGGAIFRNDAVALAMRNSKGISEARNKYYTTGKTSGTYYFGLQGLLDAGINPVQQFVGSYSWNINIVGDNLEFTIYNVTSIRSFFYDLTPGSWNTTNGPMSNFSQTFIFTEPIIK